MPTSGVARAFKLAAAGASVALSTEALTIALPALLRSDERAEAGACGDRIGGD
jgi:hypothetical protein